MGYERILKLSKFDDVPCRDCDKGGQLTKTYIAAKEKTDLDAAKAAIVNAANLACSPCKGTGFVTFKLPKKLKGQTVIDPSKYQIVLKGYELIKDKAEEQIWVLTLDRYLAGGGKVAKGIA